MVNIILFVSFSNFFSNNFEDHSDISRGFYNFTNFLQFHSVTHTTFEYWKIRRTKEISQFPIYCKTDLLRVTLLREVCTKWKFVHPRNKRSPLHSAFENENFIPLVHHRRHTSPNHVQPTRIISRDGRYKFQIYSVEERLEGYQVYRLGYFSTRPTKSDRGTGKSGRRLRPACLHYVEWIAARKRGRYLSSI